MEWLVLHPLASNKKINYKGNILIMKCEVCEKIGTDIKENHFIRCNFYQKPIHIAHCIDCKYHSYNYSGDWCKAKINKV